MMLYDDPLILYENPPPPHDYEFDFEADPVLFTYPKPQRIIGVDFIKIDRSLIHKDLTHYEEKEEDSTTKINVDENTDSERPKSVPIEEANSTVEGLNEVLVNENVPEEQIEKNKDSEEKNVSKTDLKTINNNCELSTDNDSTIVAFEKQESKQKNQFENEKEVHSNSDKSITKKKKNVQYTKSSALESISTAYFEQSYSNSDSESDKPKISKSSSHHVKSHSKKSSKHKRKDKSPRKHSSHNDGVSYDKVKTHIKKEIVSSDEDSLSSSFSKKTEITIKEEVLSDKDETIRDKIKSSKISRKKHGSDSRNKLDEKYSKNRKHRRKRRDSSSSDDSRRRYSDDDYSSRYSEDSRERFYPNREIKQEFECYKPNDLYCDVCKLILSSEVTYSTHMAGKKHIRALKLKNEKDVAKSKILDIEGRTIKPGSRCLAHQKKPYSVDIKEPHCYPKASDMERIELPGEISKIQEVCEHNRLIILGLNYVQEIRGYEETKYFCSLCSAQCVANTIIDHLTGSKHHLSCVKAYCRRTYDRIKDLDKRNKKVDKEISSKLNDAMLKCGRGQIQVFKDRKKYQKFRDPNQPSTSRKYEDEPIKKSEELVGSTEDVTDKEYLSRDYTDFYCTLCKSHMADLSIWESHARGKKHIKKKKEAPDVSDSNYNEAPRGTISRLEKMIEEQEEVEPIVGLDFIKENQGENGDVYNCFLCGSVCTTIDIMKHLRLRKHKIKYLEKMHSNGYTNSIDNICTFEISNVMMDGLIDEECWTVLKKAPKGKPNVAIAKKTYA